MKSTAGELATHPDQEVEGVFLVLQKDRRADRTTGKPYLSLQLGDQTGVVDARVWEGVEQLPPFEVNDVVRVHGRTQSYRNRLQLSVRSVDPVPPSEVDAGSFLPRTAYNVEEMFTELTAMVAGMRQPQLKALLESVLGDQEIAGRFKRAPAAKTLHHACIGGLLEHVLSVARLSGRMADHYPAVNRDLLLAGVVLHDIGKIYELSYDRSFQYTTPGKLVGHISLGVELVREKIRGLPAFPAELKLLVEHLILSHHGHLEFGSPVLPAFPEALLLHYLDDLDSKMESMRATPVAKGDEWTTRCLSLERSLLRVDRFWKDGD